MLTKVVSVVGLGKLGLCMAAVLAHRGFGVAGVDVDESKIRLINKGISPIYEPGLKKLIHESRSRLSASVKYDDAIMKSDVTFVVVPTPSDKSGGFSVKFVKPAMREIGRLIRKKRQKHLIVLTSTVLPRTMDNIVRPTLEGSSGKICGKDFALCYSPEFIALGDVVQGLLKPDFILIGESDPTSGSTLADIQEHICLNSPPIERMNFINAEIAKIALNSFVTMKMSFANTIAELCEKIRGGNVDSITAALGRDKRIGSPYLKGALGYGGPCFPRDNIAFAYFARKTGVRADLAIATHQVNIRQVQRIVVLLKTKGLRPPMKVGVLGLTYKPKTNVVEASQALMIAEALDEEGFEVHAYDPAFRDGKAGVFAPNIFQEFSAERCIAESEVCVIATPWKEFELINTASFESKTLVDCWRLFNKQNLPSTTRYIPLGMGQEIEA